jgi:hypothetical protein
MRRIRHREGGGKGRPHAHYRVPRGIRIGQRMESLSDWEKCLALVGTAAEAHAKVNREFRDSFHKAIRAFVTNPEDMALFPELFPPTYRSVH